SNGGRRGALQLAAIAAVDRLSGARQPLYQRDHAQVQTPGLPITAADVATYAAALPTDRLTLQFHTPLRLIEGDRLVKRFDPRPFVQRLSWRLDQLAVAYGDGAPLGDRAALTTQLNQLTLADDQTSWVDVVSYSSRSHQRTPIGGLVGQVTLAGDLAPLRELLVWGSLIHVGKNAVKGDGWYTIGAA
ncbi:MAG TPA: CRISPR system precrRNA processing endoribonuclease RAMP protein Cas6, partial [Roseiflexaceae bacterium]